MSYNQGLIAELKMESANTRKILERVPVEKNDWAPHEKSMKLGNLSTHLAELPEWIPRIMTADEFDLAKLEYKPVLATSSEELVSKLDTRVNKAIETLGNASDGDFDKMWTLRRGDHVIFTQPRKVAIRSFAYSHSYHHRGQLSVYLRLLNIPVPGMYGPSADERN